MATTFRKNHLLKGGKSLTELYPDIATEWNYEKNAPDLPQDFPAYSSKKVYWKCSVCGYEWEASIANRTFNHSSCPLCSGSVILSGYNDLATKNPKLALEWHPTKNLPLTPKDVGEGSGKMVWWVCEFGHSYQCRIFDRKKGVGCSECSKRYITSFPEQCVHYYVEKHFPDTIGNYKPDCLLGKEIDVYIPSLKIGIEYDGHRFHQDIERDKEKDSLCTNNGISLVRIREAKCPKYARSDLTIVLKDLSKDELSKAISGVLLTIGINSCNPNVERDKQEIEAYYRNTAIKGSLLELFPDIAEEWHPTKNGSLSPINIPATIAKDRYYWRCKKCGFEWETSLGERIMGTGCPACAGKIVVKGFNDLATTHPNLALEWHPKLNDSLTPTDVSKGMSKRVWWKCSKCGHEWAVRIRNRVAGSGCPQCAHTITAQKLREKAKGNK